jgi:hypothetical protein
MNPATAIIPPVIFRLRLMSAPHLANHPPGGKDEASGLMTVNRKLPPVLINTSLQRGVAGAPWNFNRFNGLPQLLDN